MKKTTKPFSKLTAADKRVAIARDVLKQIKANQYAMTKGTWLYFNYPTMPKVPTGGSRTQTILTGTRQIPPAKCTCCGIGAACASAIRLFNRHELPEDEVGSMEHAQVILARYFSRTQFELIEAAFERRTNGIHGTASRSALCRAVAFSSHWWLSDRAEDIFKNIVKNHGTFKP